MDKFASILEGLCVAGSVFLGVPSIINMVMRAEDYGGTVITLSILMLFFAIFFGIYYYKYDDEKNKTKKIISDYDEREKIRIKEHDKALMALEGEYQKRTKILEAREKRMEAIIQTNKPFIYSAKLAADMRMHIYDYAIDYLTWKKRSARTTAARIEKELRQKTKEYVAKYKEMQYKYEFMLSTFPDLKPYLDDDEALENISVYNDLSEFDENRDKVMDFLSQEEWNSLSIDERNQLALDRYIKKDKSTTQIGLEYEMYIDFLFREKGYKTIPHGALMGYNDLGRDVIAIKDNEVLIIQCKNWSQRKEIHENVICQIFGTSIAYEIENHLESLDFFSPKVIPVIATTAPLNEMAQKFAQRLGVRVLLIAKGDFPMIKCNINKTPEGKETRIYHLPFDQQYRRTKIEKPGEFYAWTIKEATSKGFRRALRHTINK